MYSGRVFQIPAAVEQITMVKQNIYLMFEPIRKNKPHTKNRVWSIIIYIWFCCNVIFKVFSPFFFDAALSIQLILKTYLNEEKKKLKTLLQSTNIVICMALKCQQFWYLPIKGNNNDTLCLLVYQVYPFGICILSFHGLETPKILHW